MKNTNTQRYIARFLFAFLRNDSFNKSLSISLWLLTVGSMMLLSSCKPKANQSQDLTSSPSEVQGTLNVLDWAGYDANDFWIDFKEKYPKTKVNFSIGASDSDIYAKMSAGDKSDIFHIYSGWLNLYITNGIIEEIDTTQLKNWDKVPEHFKAMGRFEGKQYFIPWDWGFSSILYRSDKIPEGVDSWHALLDEKYKGHISMWDESASAVQTSCYIRGWDETKLTPAQLEEIKQEWIKQRDINLFYWTGEPELIDGISGGDVWVAYAWQGAYAVLLQKGIPVVYADPKEGRNSWIGWYAIRKGTKNYDLALKFLDEKLAERTGNNVVQQFYYGHSNQDVMKAIKDETLIKTFSLDNPDVLSRTHYTPELTPEQRSTWTAMWAEVKAAQ